ncbi:MAG: AAA family ATPase, partial [Desulfovibrionaceae bacterium]|nr:AAA family ATPase [Desulfovibrionaceae bacterium]
MSVLNIGTGISVFRKLRKEGFYYVDKTDFISEFLTSMTSEVSLITRPRRFGKSLTMSMLAEFFDNQQESSDIFAGLKISED